MYSEEEGTDILKKEAYKVTRAPDRISGKNQSMPTKILCYLKATHIPAKHAKLVQAKMTSTDWEKGLYLFESDVEMLQNKSLGIATAAVSPIWTALSLC